ncbi:hypothetical protein PC9H_007909 [Pleurotus ostreatus]|uniref:Uncharacterized protein n=1 Tax=Pleurotus ostreatus TaxID=5322 RepID=A0A8H6ZS09_PLEOS|nr:uncharacterized protein PC9H_007909 [Pleurotus ostreatus]KAF7428680.1 hypothetical protein PC9H_007909 [Pleurotus ostreatus]KAJ8696869.1 hypothetical protein PTI98_006697 [Pleurotus ostreatus]
MEHEQTLQEVEAKLTQSYVEQFRQHTQEVRTHLAGKTADELPPSFVPPAGYWTSAEKDLFFRGICTYSRLRPDLISESIGTKSMLDVCTYIDILESASARAPTRESDSGTNRADTEIAMEMSRSWIKWENGQASALATAEPLWEAAETERLQEATLAEKAATVPSELTREAFLAWKVDREARWSADSVLNNLGKYHLKVMDAVLNDGKPEPDEDEQISDSARHHDGAVGSLEPSAPATSATAVRAAANSVHRHSAIDTNNSERNVIQPGLKRRAATPPGEGDAAEMNGADLASMSPTSRRRFQKRLYMRRKRAELAGGTVDTTTEKFKPGRKPKERLPRPRPKAYATRKQQRISKKPRHDSPSSEGDEDEEGTGSQSESTMGGSGGTGDASTLDNNPTCTSKSEGDYAHPHISGVTQPYKVKTELESLGLINAEELRAAELDFFRLAPLSRMMNAYRAPSDSETFISANTIRLVKKIVTEFITRMVQLSIVAQEQEARLKADKKVWRMPSTPIVTAANVVLAADMMGVPTLNQRPAEIRTSGNDLDACTALAAQPRAITDNPSEPGSDEEDSEPEDDKNLPSQYSHSLCRQLNPAFVRLPPNIGTLLSSASGQDRIVQDVEEDLLELELEEEEYLNEQDKLVEQAFEKELWKIIGGSVEL